MSTPPKVLWDRNRLQNLQLHLASMGLLVDGMRPALEPDSFESPYSAIPTVEAAWAAVIESNDRLDNLITGLANCIAWAPDHPYHARYQLAVPELRSMQSAFQTCVDVMLADMILLELDLQQMETAAEAISNGKAFIGPDDQVCLLA